MRCLFVTKEYSTTPTSGGTLRTLALSSHLARHYETEIISPDGAVVASGGRLRSFARYRSISAARTAGARLLENLRLGAHGHYELVVVDHTCIGALADELAGRADQVVVSMHNIESQLMARRASRAPSASAHLARSTEALLLRRLETRLARRYPVVVCTEEDAAVLPSGSDPVVCRNGVFAVGSAPGIQRPRRERSAVFAGALDWEPNVEGLTWFVEEVWPTVRNRVPGAHLTVAGRRPGRRVLGLCAAPGIDLVPDPPVMADVLASPALGIVPLLTGGGSRIKILEYLQAGLGVVSTEAGAAGLGDVPPDLLTRTAPENFASAMVSGLRAPPDASRAGDWVRTHYCWDVTLQALDRFCPQPVA